MKQRMRDIFLQYDVAALIIAMPALLLGQQNAATTLSDLKINLQSADFPHQNNGIDCISCHLPHKKADAQPNTLKGNANLCISCHNPAGVASDRPFADLNRAKPGISGNSHAWDVPATSDAHGAAEPTNTEMAQRIYDGHIVCSTCHNQHSQEFPPFLRASNEKNALCKDCHAIRDVGSFRAAPENKGSHPVGTAYPTADPRFHSQPANSDLPLVDPDRVECTTCHRLHFADSGGANDGTGDGYVLRATNDDAFCTACHTYGEHEGQGCRQCHQPHDPERANIFLVKPAIKTPTSGEKQVAFLAETGSKSLADGDSNYGGICEVCHTATNYHRNDDSGNHTHNAGQNCTTCHAHADGFRADLSACNECHNVPQDNGDNAPAGGRRAVLAEFETKSHHLQSESLDLSDCLICHEMSQHTGGAVRLVDRDSLGVIYMLANRPMDDPNESRKIEPFCLNCHDGDADQPFSDGQTPEPIDADLWNASSHKLGGRSKTALGCMGDGESSGCHSTGHGSNKRKLLAPADASQPPVSGDSLREEEGMCYSCHDADGPSTENIQAEFRLASRHNVSSRDQTDGSKVECRNCHNPHIASASATLIDPDTDGKSPWRSDKSDFCLSCHDGNAPADVSFPSKATGTGFDKSRFAGTAHDAGLGNDSCQRCHRDHGSAFISLLKSKYVIQENIRYSSSNFQACWDCHSESDLIQKKVKGDIDKDKDKDEDKDREGTGFGKLHGEHIEEKIPCIACHDAHGPHDRGEPGLISFAFAQNSGFDFQLIDGRSLSSAFWIDGANNEGNCYLKCHGEQHKPEKYKRN